MRKSRTKKRTDMKNDFGKDAYYQNSFLSLLDWYATQPYYKYKFKPGLRITAFNQNIIHWAKSKGYLEIRENGYECLTELGVTFYQLVKL